MVPSARRPTRRLSLGWKVDNPDKDDLRYRLKYRLVGTNNWFDLTEPDEKLTKDSYDWETGRCRKGGTACTCRRPTNSRTRPIA